MLEAGGMSDYSPEMRTDWREKRHDHGAKDIAQPGCPFGLNRPLHQPTG